MSNPFVFIETNNEHVYCQGCHCCRGSNDYNQLLNKPSINGKPLIGNIEIKGGEGMTESLFIGDVEYNGSKEVRIPLYKGE